MSQTTTTKSSPIPINEDFPLMEASSERTILGCFHLRKEVTIFNFISYLICVFFSILFIVFLNQIQAFLFALKFNLTDNIGSVSGTFTLADELVSLVFVLIWGLVSDRIGRRLTFTLGFLIVGLSLFFYTLPNRALPDLLLVRLVFAIGASAITSMVAAGLADIAGAKNAMTSGIVGLFSGLGAVVSVFVLVPLPNSLEKHTSSPVQGIVYTLYIVGGLAILWSIITFFTYSKVSVSKNDDEMPQRLTIQQELSSGLSKVPRAFKLMFQDIRIAMAYISGFVARGDTIILTTFISAWVVKAFVDEGRCFVSGDLLDPSIIKKDCRQAYALSMMLSGIAQVFALLGAPIVGVLLIKIPPTIILSLSSLLGSIGYFAFGFTSDPRSKAIYAWICFLGIGEIGTIVTSLSFLSSKDKVDADIRGMVSGIYSFFGGLGIIVCSKLGGHLFDIWRPGAPFIIMGLFHAILFVMGFICYFVEFWQKRKSNTSRNNST